MYGYASGMTLSQDELKDMREIRRIALISQRFRTIIEDPDSVWGNEVTEHM